MLAHSAEALPEGELGHQVVVAGDRGVVPWPAVVPSGENEVQASGVEALHATVQRGDLCRQEEG